MCLYTVFVHLWGRNEVFFCLSQKKMHAAVTFCCYLFSVRVLCICMCTYVNICVCKYMCVFLYVYVWGATRCFFTGNRGDMTPVTVSHRRDMYVAVVNRHFTKQRRHVTKQRRYFSKQRRRVSLHWDMPPLLPQPPNNMYVAVGNRADMSQNRGDMSAV